MTELPVGPISQLVPEEERWRFHRATSPDVRFRKEPEYINDRLERLRELSATISDIKCRFPTADQRQEMRADWQYCSDAQEAAFELGIVYARPDNQTLVSLEDELSYLIALHQHVRPFLDQSTIESLVQRPNALFSTVLPGEIAPQATETNQEPALLKSSEGTLPVSLPDGAFGLDSFRLVGVEIRGLSAFAEGEAKAVSDRTKAALQAAKVRRQKLGSTRPGHWAGREDARLEGLAKAREVSKKVRADAADEAYADLLPEMRQLRSEGQTLQQIADTLNEQGHTTRRGKPWNSVQVMRVLGRAN